MLPLAQELILSKYCFWSTLNAGTWRASPALYTPQRVPMRRSEVSLEKPDRDGGIQRLATGCLLPDWPGKYRRVGMVRVTST